MICIEQWQPLAMSRHPAERAAWIANQEGIILNIVRHHGARGNEGVLTNCHAAHDSLIRPKGCAAPHARRRILTSSYDMNPRGHTAVG